MSENQVILSDEQCLTQAQLLRYVQDDCSAKELRAADAHLAHCPMCSDAVDGLLMNDGTNDHEQVLTNIDQKIKSTYHSKDVVNEPIVMVEKPLSVIHSLRDWRAVAAGLALLLSVGLSYYLVNNINEKPLAQDLKSSQETTEIGDVPSSVEAPSAVPEANNQPSANMQVPEKGKSKQEVILTDKSASGNVATTEAVPAQKPTAATQPTSINEDNELLNKNKMSQLEEVKVEADVAKYDDATSYKEKEVVAESVKKQSTQVKPTAQVPMDIDAYQGASNTGRSPSSAKENVTKQERIPSSDKLYEEGFRYFNATRYKDAIVSFNNLLAIENQGRYYELSLWYLANSYWESGENKKAKKIFNRIVSEQLSFQGKASEILANWKNK